MNKKIYYIAIGFIYLLSFRFYSSLFYPILNSDNAVSILMIHYFKLPNDLYFWGQDRIGSLIPLLGQVLFKGFNLSALTSESIIHYLILLVGFLAFSTFLKSYFYKLVFAVIWFFPPMRFIDVIQLYSGVQYSLIAIACYLFNVYQKQKVRSGVVFRHATLFSITLLLITAIWVSDMAMITVFILLVIYLYFYLRANRITFALLGKPELYYAFFGIAAGYLFFHYAKERSPNQLDYATFSSIDNVQQTFVILWRSIADLFAFRGGELLTSVYVYLLLIVFVFVILRLKHIDFNDSVKKWMLFFFMDTVLVFIVIMVSNWTFLNGVPRRYFTYTYISLSITILLIMDNLSREKEATNSIKAILSATVFIGGIGALYNMKYFWPRTLTPKVEIVSEFGQLGKIGIIAEYWNSYIVACPDPDNIKATPNDESYVRSPEMVEEVFRQKDIYIIKDTWLKMFPDSLKQFNRILIKNGEEFRIGDCVVCKYRKAE